MISLDKLAQVSKFRERELHLPPDNQFTQQTAVQMKVAELERLQQATENVVIKHTMESEFIEQHTVQDPMELLEEDNEIIYMDDSVSNSLVYEENEVIDAIPAHLSPLKLSGNSWYLYGVRNPNSYYKSLLYITDQDVLLKSHREKVKFVATFQQEMAIMTDTIFKKNNYRDMKFNKKDIRQNIMNNECTYPALVLSADYIKQDICIIDIVIKRYQLIESAETNNREPIVIIQEVDTYLPLMNTEGNHNISMAILDNIKNNFEKIDVPTLVTVGENDMCLPPSFSRELADGIKGAELIIFPGGSHLFGVQDPPTFNRATLDWLARVGA